MSPFSHISFLQIIEIESAQVEAKRKIVKLDEEIASGKAEEAQALKNECESDLAEAIPALEAALSALDTLKESVGFALGFHQEKETM